MVEIIALNDDIRYSGIQYTTYENQIADTHML